MNIYSLLRTNLSIYIIHWKTNIRQSLFTGLLTTSYFSLHHYFRKIHLISDVIIIDFLLFSLRKYSKFRFCITERSFPLYNFLKLYTEEATIKSWFLATIKRCYFAEFFHWTTSCPSFVGSKYNSLFLSF